MKMRDLRELDTESLQQKAAELREELRETRDAVWAGKEQNHARLGQLRRDIARVRTVLNKNK